MLPLSMQTAGDDHVTTVQTYRVSHTSGPIRIDGLLDEFDWLEGQRMHFVKFSHDPEDHKPLRESTELAAIWDDQNLYLGFIVRDREMWAKNQQRDTRLWPEECIEIYLDPDGDGRRYIEAQINWHNNIRDILVDGHIENPTPAQFDEMARWNFQHLQSAVRVFRTAKGEDLGWTLEMAIPWTDLNFSHRNFPPKPGETIRINFYRVERPRQGSLPVEWSGWSPVPGDFHDPTRFGQFVFTAAPSGTDLR
jgi:hypothetical protein